MSWQQRVYERYLNLNRDPISDAECKNGADHFLQLANLLYASGPAFRLAANEANRVYLALNASLVARGIEIQ